MLLHGCKLTVVVMFAALVIGRVAIEVVSAFSPDPTRHTASSKNPLAMATKLMATFKNGASVPQEMKDQIIQSYKDNYGDNWKEKLKEDYASRKQ